jgi:SAM-dependent methyltransferase
MSLPETRKRPFLLRALHAVLLRISPVALIPTYLDLADTFLSLSNLLITKKHGNVHPKHEIMRYEDFFLRFIEPSTTVLDVGCGNGTVAAKLASRAKHVTGVELDRDRFSFARSHYSAPNLEFVLGDITSLEPRTLYDICVLSNVLEHIEDRIGLLVALKKQASVLLIRVPAMDRDWWPAYRKANGLEWRSDDTHFIEHTEDELRAEISAAGWTVVSLERRWGEFYVHCTQPLRN